MSTLEQLILDLKASMDHQFGEIRQQIAGLDQRVSGLDQRVSGLDQRVSDLDRQLQDGRSHTHNLEQLIIDFKESLERQIAASGRETRQSMEEIKSRFDIQSARLDRQAGLWQVGSRWSSRMDAWAEKVDSALMTKDQQIAELRERIQKLEDGSKP